jgi:D-alanine transfer protein
LYAGQVEGRYIHALAPKLTPQTIHGSVLQREAFRSPDLLVVYGSSEISMTPGAFDAATIFRSYPTGFAPFEVAQIAKTSLITAQDVAAIGPELQGQRVVISFTPAMFLDKAITTTFYAGNFSTLHAYELAFSSSLSFETKQRAARRMLQYPATLASDPLLRFTLQRLSDGDQLDRVLYAAVLPLGKLHNLVTTLQDHWATLVAIQKAQPLDSEVPHVPTVIDWQQLAAKARNKQRIHANSNPFGFDNEAWTGRLYWRMTAARPHMTDQDFLQALQTSAEWTDLDILLRILQELGARPLLLSRPLNGVYWDAVGVSPQGRQDYYEKLRHAVRPYNVALVDFADYEADRFFSVDPLEHTSREGWVYVDQALDNFYHAAPN